MQVQKERSTDHIKNIIMRESEKGQVPEIPDYAIDMHTIKGRAMGRDVFFFLDEAKQGNATSGKATMIPIVSSCIRCAREEAEAEKNEK